MKRRTNQTTRTPLIALDGPSALSWYRDRDDRAHNPEAESYDFLYDEPMNTDCLTDDYPPEDFANIHVLGHVPADTFDENGETGIGNTKLARTRIQGFKRCTCQSRELKRVPYDSLGIRMPDTGSPLHVLIARAEDRRVVQNVHVRLCSDRVPTNSLRRLGSNVLVPTPELTFLLLASRLSLIELILVGMELCGHYRLANAQTTSLLTSNRTVYGCSVLTTPARLTSLLDRADGFRGAARAQRALKYLTPNSSSPMETALYLLLCLPRNLGGYAFARPLLNAKRAVNSYAGSFTFSRNLIPDLYWPDIRLDMEYDSDEFHASPECLAAGARRTLALRAMHVEVISMTRDVLYDEAAFAGVARMIALRLKKRILPPDEKAYRHRINLRNHVLGSHERV